MAETPVVLSTALGLGSSDSDDPGSLSSATIRAIHRDELCLLRSHLTSAVALTVLAASAWIAAEVKGTNSAFAFLLGYATVIGLFKTARAGRRMWILSRHDPVAIAIEEAAARKQAQSLAAAHAARLAARPAYATGTIGVVLVVIAVLEVVAVGSVTRTIAVAGLDKTRLVTGEWWRLLTAGFLHGAPIHLSANLAALLAIGSVVEAYSTRSRVLLAYLVAVVAGNLASWWWLPHTSSLGASGGILGLAGFMYALSRRQPDDVPASYGRAAVTMMILTALVGLVGFRFIDNAAHAGGALAGFLVGWLTVPRQLPPAERFAARYDGDRVMSIMGVMAALVLVAAAALTATKLFAERPRSVTSLRAELSRRADGGVDLALENLKDVPLEAYTLEVYSSNVLAFRQWRDERGFEAWRPNGNDGALAPHERRIVPLGDPGRPVAHLSVRVVAADFKDGTFEGSAAEYDVIAGRRADVVADLDYWIGVIDEAVTKPPDQRSEFISKKIGERARVKASTRHTTFMGGMGGLMGTAVHTPERFEKVAGEERAQLVALRDELRSSVR